jgi:hypothetical protein
MQPTPSSSVRRIESTTAWRIYWPEEEKEGGAVHTSDGAPQSLIGWRVGRRCLVVAALVPRHGAVEERLALWGSAEGKAPRPCVLGEYVTAPGTGSGDSNSSDGVDASGVWLIMEPGPRVRGLLVCGYSTLCPAGEEEACAPPTIAIVLYRRPHHACPPPSIPEGCTRLDSCLGRMARASHLQRALSLNLEPLRSDSCGPAAAPASQSSTVTVQYPPLLLLLVVMVQSSLACIQLRARGTAAWRVLRRHQGPSAGVGLLVDSLLGAALGLLLWRRGAPLVAALVEWNRQLLHPEALERGVAWLASDPGGFKLNLPLTRRLGAVVVLVAELYTSVLRQAAPVTTIMMMQWPHYLVAVGVGGGGLVGATTLVAGGFDLLRVLTGHVPLIHASIARLYRLELCTLASLGRLFRGRKRNILRHRVDSCEYSTQQLLLGTLLFTICVALFPTLAAFHAFATALHLAVRALQAALWLMLVLMRDLPLHTLALRLCCPSRFLDPLRVARCSPCKRPEGGSTAALHVALRTKDRDKGPDGVTGAGGIVSIVDTKEEEEQQQQGAVEHGGAGPKPPPPSTRFQATQTLLRLEYARVPWASLFDGYARTARALRQAAPSPGRALGAVLAGSLLMDAEGEQEDEEGGRQRPRLAFFQYRSLPQILVEAALISSS